MKSQMKEVFKEIASHCLDLDCEATSHLIDYDEQDLNNVLLIFQHVSSVIWYNKGLATIDNVEGFWKRLRQYVIDVTWIKPWENL